MLVTPGTSRSSGIQGSSPKWMDPYESEITSRYDTVVNHDSCVQW